MAKLRLLFWLGVVMLFLSFVGIPDTMKVITAIGVGACIIALAFLLRRDHRRVRAKYVEHAPHVQPLIEDMSQNHHG